MPAVRVWLTRRRRHPSPVQVEAVAVAVAVAEEPPAAERGLMAAAERKLAPTDSVPEPRVVQRARRGMPVSAGTAPSWRARSPQSERTQANHRARVMKMAKESTREDRMRVLIAIAEPVECALPGAGREQGERPFRKRLFQLAARGGPEFRWRAHVRVAPAGVDEEDLRLRARNSYVHRR